MLDKLEEIYSKYLLLEEQMSDPEVISDMKKYKKTSQDYKELKPIVEAYQEYKGVLEGIESSKEMLKEEDEEMREMAKEELNSLKKSEAELNDRIKFLLIPKDPEDSKDVMVEIRSGAGGDEAAIFAGDLYRMYSKFFESQGFKVEIVSLNVGSSFI